LQYKNVSYGGLQFLGRPLILVADGALFYGPLSREFLFWGIFMACHILPVLTALCSTAFFLGERFDFGRFDDLPHFHRKRLWKRAIHIMVLCPSFRPTSKHAGGVKIGAEWAKNLVSVSEAESGLNQTLVVHSKLTMY